MISFKTATFLTIIISLVLLACQKPDNQFSRPQLPPTIDSVVLPAGMIAAGDTITYEVLTTEPGGWFGAWNDGNGKMISCVLDSVTFGSPVCLPSGWRHSVVIPGKTFQPYISAASKVFNKDVTVNIYKHDQLLATKSSIGVAWLLLASEDSPVPGTAPKPVVTYEVTVSDVDTTKALYDAWMGHWNEPTNVNSWVLNPLYMILPVSSGWRYSFEPVQLPFVMNMQASPYTKDGALVTIKFYVNGKLVAASSERNWNYPPLTYEVK